MTTLELRAIEIATIIDPMSFISPQAKPTNYDQRAYLEAIAYRRNAALDKAKAILALLPAAGVDDAKS